MQERTHSKRDENFSTTKLVSTLIKKDAEKFYEPAEKKIDELRIFPKDLTKLIAQYLLLTPKYVLPFVDPRQQMRFVNSLGDHYKDYIFQSPEEVAALGNSFDDAYNQAVSVHLEKPVFEIIDSLGFPLVINQLILDYYGALTLMFEGVCNNITEYANDLRVGSYGVVDYSLLSNLNEACQALSRGEKTFNSKERSFLYKTEGIPKRALLYSLNYIMFTTINKIFINTQSPKTLPAYDYFEYAPIVRNRMDYLTPTERETALYFDYSLRDFARFTMDNLFATNTHSFKAQPIYLYWHQSGKEIVLQFNDEKCSRNFLAEFELDPRLVQDKCFKNCLIFPIHQTKTGEMALDFKNQFTLTAFIRVMNIQKMGKDKKLKNGQTIEYYNIGCSRYIGDGQGKTLIFEKDHPIFKNDADPKCLKIAGNNKALLISNIDDKEFPLLKIKKSFLSRVFNW